LCQAQQSFFLELVLAPLALYGSGVFAVTARTLVEQLMSAVLAWPPQFLALECMFSNMKAHVQLYASAVLED
jgi:hypothetical protein